MLILNAFFACGFTPVSFGFSAVLYLHVVTLRRQGNPLSFISQGENSSDSCVSQFQLHT